MHTPELLYKVVTRDTFESRSRDGFFFGMPIDRADGFCHLSTATQLAETLSLHFRAQPDLMILAVRSDDLAPKLRWEPSRGGQLFPHFYGELPLSAIAWTGPVSVDAEGGVSLPEAVA